MEHPLSLYKLVLFDLDGSIRFCKAHHGPCHAGPGEWQLYDDVPAVLAQYDWVKIAWGVASNQAGVALGYLTAGVALQEAYKTIQAAFGGQVPSRGRIRICMHAPTDGCACRKPAPGMLWQQQAYWECTLDETLFVGDSLEDAQAADRAGCAFIQAYEFFGRPKPVWATWTQAERDVAYREVAETGGRLE